MSQAMKGLACGTNIGGAAASNVKGGAMGGCRHRKGDAALYGYTTVKTHQFQRNLPLIMIHGDDAVDLAGLGFQKHRIRGPGTIDIQLLVLQILDGWADDLDLLHAEIAIVAGMRIERGN